MKQHQVDFYIYNATDLDAIEIWSLKRALHDEGEFLRLSPHEIKETINDEIVLIRSTESRNRLILVVKDIQRIFGYLSACVNDKEKKITRVTLGVLKEYHGNGVGSAFIKRMENWACSMNIKEIEMNVMTHNLPALGLYQKVGYQIIGATPLYKLYDSDKFVYDYILRKELMNLES